MDSVVNTRLSQGDTGADVYFLQQQGIRVDSDNKSILLVNATLENNGTNIRCLTGLDAIRLTVISNTAMLMVFGKLMILVVALHQRKMECMVGKGNLSKIWSGNEIYIHRFCFLKTKGWVVIQVLNT